MNKKRLLNVARALRESKTPNRFTMRTYAHAACGTPACALGHYAARGDLQRTLSLKNGELVHRNGEHVCFDSPEVRDHFGITLSQAWGLFAIIGCGNAQTPKQAARFIERFVKAGGRWRDKKCSTRRLPVRTCEM